MSIRVDVEPDGETIVTPVEEASAAPMPIVVETREPDPELQAALSAARERGRLRAAEILAGDDMLSADDFARMLGTTRVTVNTKRQSGQVLGLDGAKRGFRFPVWQLDGDGRPFAELATLHERLGGPWAVELQADLNASVAEPPARPRAIRIFDPMPTTAVGKIFKPTLRLDAARLEMEALLLTQGVIADDISVAHDEGGQITIKVILADAFASNCATIQGLIERYPVKAAVSVKDGVPASG